MARTGLTRMGKDARREKRAGGVPVRERWNGRTRSGGDRRVAAVAAAIVVVGALGVGTGMSYAGQNGRGAPIQAVAAATSDCSLIVPADPLSAKGLATPYELVGADGNQGACHEADDGRAAFVQASVIDPATGKVSVYNPLVIDMGTRPAVAPVAPALPKNAVVGIWFGFNGDNLTLRDSRGSLKAGACVNGVTGSIFTQFAYCNAPTFFAAATASIKGGKLRVPPLGTGSDGNPCPTTRDFTVVDQDQSDNVTSAYLIQGTTVAQDTAGNRAKLPKATVQVNGSDNLLLVHFIDRAVGCTPFQAPDLADNGALTTSLALDELQAAAAQGNPVALVPPNDPMAETDGHPSTAKLNLYRQGVDMPAVANTGGLAATYCQQLVDLAPKRLEQDRKFTRAAASPDPAAANSLFTFLAQRLSGSYGNLGCDKLIKSANPVRVKVRNGVAIDASFAGQPGTPTSAAPTSAAPTSAAPTSAAPTSAAPTSAAPTSASPTGAGPTGGSTRPTKGESGRATPAPTLTSTATPKDDLTPTASPPARTGQATAGRPSRGQSTSAQATAAPARAADSVKSAEAVKPQATATKAGGHGRTGSGSGSVAPAATGATSAADYSYSNDDGVADAGTQAPTAGGVKQGNVVAGAPPTKNALALALTGGNSLVLIAGGVVLILVGMSIMALIQRRRSRGAFY
jgi:hypothetical protein